MASLQRVWTPAAWFLCLRAFSPLPPILSPKLVLAIHTVTANTSSASDLQTPPKRPPNAYVLFVTEKLSESRDREFQRPYKDLVKELGATWNSMSDHDKERYKQLHALQKGRWENDYEAFLKTVPDKEEYLEQLKVLRLERRKQLKMIREKRKNKLTKPPRKLSAYNIYVRDQLAGVTKEELKARFTEVAQTWKTLSDSEKEEYALEAQQIHDHEVEEFNSRAQDTDTTIA